MHADNMMSGGCCYRRSVASSLASVMSRLPLLLLVVLLQLACHVTATVTHRLELETCIGMDIVRVCLCVCVASMGGCICAYASDT